jgi:tRNA (cytidine/uridine-2'-O-)-methyltransferase
MTPRIALFQPEIPHNTGALIRLSACMGTPLEVIGPTGFDFDDARLRRAGLDYHDMAAVTVHESWAAFRETRPERLILSTTKGDRSAYGFGYRPDDILLFGSETAGAPDHVHAAAAARIRLPMRLGARSLNLALAAGMVLGEALRATDRFPDAMGSV